MRNVKVSKRSERLIMALAEAGMYHGWQQDQGTGREPAKAERSYQQALAALRRHVARLEKARG